MIRGRRPSAPMFTDCKMVINPPSGDQLFSWKFVEDNGKIVAVDDNSTNDGFR